MEKDKQDDLHVVSECYAPNTENNYLNVINYVKHLRPLSLLRKVEIFLRRGTLWATCFKSVVFCLVACGLVKTYGHASVLLLSNCT